MFHAIATVGFCGALACMATLGRSNARCGRYFGCSGSRPYVMTCMLGYACLCPLQIWRILPLCDDPWQRHVWTRLDMFGHVCLVLNCCQGEWLTCFFRSELLPGGTTDMSWHGDQLYLIVSGVISDLLPGGTSDMMWHVYQHCLTVQVWRTCAGGISETICLALATCFVCQAMSWSFFWMAGAAA